MCLHVWHRGRRQHRRMMMSLELSARGYPWQRFLSWTPMYDTSGSSGKNQVCLIIRDKDAKVVNHEPPGASVEQLKVSTSRTLSSVAMFRLCAVTASARVTLETLQRQCSPWVSWKPRTRKLLFISEALAAKSPSSEQIPRKRRNWLWITARLQWP